MNNDIQKQYPWAANKSKLERAINEVRNSGQKETDESVKLVYVRLLGKVVDGSEPTETVSLEDMSLADLKKLAKARGLKTSGTRNELIKSINQAPGVSGIDDDIDSDDNAEVIDLTESKKDEDDE